MRAVRTPGEAGRDEALAAFAQEGCSQPRSWGNGPGDTYGRHDHPRAKVLFCLEGSGRVPHRRGRRRAHRRGSARSSGGHTARGDGRLVGLQLCGSVGSVRVAFHVDQLLVLGARRDRDVRAGAFVPHGDRGRYRDRSVLITVARPGHASGVDVKREAPTLHLQFPIEVLYPAWSMARRPHLPRSFGPIDLIHATNHAAIAPARRGQALVVTVHDLAFERFPELFPPRWLKLYRRGLSIARDEADLVLVPSAFTATELERAGVERDRIRVTPLAGGSSWEIEPGDVDEEARARELSEPYVLAVGTIEPRKNLDRLVRAFRRAVEDTRLPHVLVLAGDVGWHEEELLERSAAIRRGRVRYVGRVADASLPALRRDAAADRLSVPVRRVRAARARGAARPACRRCRRRARRSRRSPGTPHCSSTPRTKTRSRRGWCGSSPTPCCVTI